LELAFWRTTELSLRNGTRRKVVSGIIRSTEELTIESEADDLLAPVGQAFLKLHDTRNDACAKRIGFALDEDAFAAWHVTTYDDTTKMFNFSIIQ
jgi:hypothetical protein